MPRIAPPALLEDPDFMAALTRAAIANPANSDIYAGEFAAFVDTFARIAKPPEFRYLFFVAGGALAVENAMKMSPEPLPTKLPIRPRAGPTRRATRFS